MKILIIDDDLDLLKMIARKFSRKGYTPLLASNLTEAIELFQTHPDLIGVVCDYFLQKGENGLSFYEKYLREQFKGKFVLVTGDKYADDKIKKYEKEDKLFYSVEKPYCLDKILELIRFNA